MSKNLILLIAMVGVLWLINSDYFPSVVPNTNTVDRVTYVYEKNEGAVPRPVSYVLRKLSETGIVATELEVDPENGLGGIPEQDLIATNTAKEIGLPCLVVQASENVLATMKGAKTVADMNKTTGIEIKEPE